MNYQNKAHIVGQISDSPKLKAFGDNKVILSWTIMTKKEWIRDETGEIRHRSEWHRCKTFFPKLSNLIMSFSPGDWVEVIGEIQTRYYEDAAQNKKYMTEILIADRDFHQVRKISSNEQDLY